MYMSRHLEETRKTKFRKGTREEELRKNRKAKVKHQSVEGPRGFDMWGDDIVEDDHDAGC